MNELRLRKILYRQIRPRLKKRVTGFDVSCRATPPNNAAFPIEQPACTIPNARDVIINWPAKHRRVPAVGLMPRRAVARVPLHELVKEVSAGPTARERENGQHGPRAPDDTSLAAGALPMLGAEAERVEPRWRRSRLDR